jgi:type IV pilus assembly protein PilP
MKFFQSTLMVIFLIVLSACHRKQSHLHEALKKKQEPAPYAVESIPVFKEVVPEVYQEKNYRSPFQSRRVKKMYEDGSVAPKKIAAQMYELEALAFIGVLENDEKKWALVLAPDGVVHRVIEGDYLGKYAGKVLGISKKDMVVSQDFKNEWGDAMTRQVVLLLQK